MEGRQPKRPVKTVNTSFQIIDSLQEMGDTGLSELSSELELPPSTVHKHLMTLISNGYVVKNGTKYELSYKFYSIGMNVKRADILVNVAKPFLKQMVEESNELAWLAKEEHGYAVFLEKAEGAYAVQPYSNVGDRELMHHSAAGKAMLAHMPEDRVAEIIETRGLKRYTENTITNENDLRTELENIREQGYSLNRGETLMNHRAIGSPVIYEGEVKGSIVLSGPRKRMSGNRFKNELPELVTGTGNAIELELRKWLQSQEAPRG